MPLEIMGASNATQGLLRVSNATQGYWGVKCHPGVLGRQMPPGGIGASNATQGYWGVICHIGIIGASKATQASKGRRQDFVKPLKLQIDPSLKRDP